MSVIPQPDGSVACIPSWMLREAAARYALCDEPRLGLDVMRVLRAELDALLGFLQPASTKEKACNLRKAANHQPDLFAEEEPPVRLATAQKDRLTRLVEALLIEIAAALAVGEAGDD